MHIISRRTPTGRCRVCKALRYDTDTDRGWIAAHQACWDAAYEAHRPRREALNDLLAPWDPELEDHMRREYQAGRLRPSTDPV